MGPGLQLREAGEWYREQIEGRTGPPILASAFVENLLTALREAESWTEDAARKIAWLEAEVRRICTAVIPEGVDCVNRVMTRAIEARDRKP